ncbi:MAG: type II toxin-antitoxin system PemK/MazF family toxin, partial [Acidimicrobiia bacterium]|nr:type II toxin-antitoxin system PemK/MazF family toxin [Acidimicrobiia bacterium]
MSPLPARGEVWWCAPPDIGRRPVVVLSRDAAIPRLRRALVAP